jgi:hypothetical protein
MIDVKENLARFGRILEAFLPRVLWDVRRMTGRVGL